MPRGKEATSLLDKLGVRLVMLTQTGHVFRFMAHKACCRLIGKETGAIGQQSAHQSHFGKASGNLRNDEQSQPTWRNCYFHTNSLNQNTGDLSQKIE